MAKFTLKAEPRIKLKRQGLEKLRAAGRLPGNIYGHKKPNRLISLDKKEMQQFIQAGHRILTVAVDGVEEEGVLKEVQYDSLGTDLIHIDITRIDIHERISMSVRVETVGVPKGIAAGGNLDLPKREVLVEGPASSIPEKIQVRIEHLELGQALRIKDLAPIPECRYVDDGEQVVAAILLKKLEEVAPAAPAAATPEMPEVIGKKKEEGEPEAEPEGGKKKEKEKDKDSEGKK
jgi:large subunit ribosomal protein L25